MTGPNTSADFFESMFATSADPWNFAMDEYEQARYRHVLRAIGPGPYRRALEPGCSVGALTQELATVCQRVDASDISPSAVSAARTRCATLPGVTVQLQSLHDIATCDGYDLVVLSEVGYYFALPEWQVLVGRLVDTMQPGTVVLLSHWLGYSADHILSGDQVHDAAQHVGLRHELGERHPHPQRAGFRLDRWRRP